ncbi:3-isopropylmalate dehydratase small subunit [Bradyrhizobium sp. B120]|uniref:3-isopropylmalate dehydratase small subunit n=1 Tax=Bradyrhizobium sp. B120 TaxID=3410088 RepID=UPI003B97D3D9
MQPFTEVTGPAASLPRANVDTDVIIRIERLTSVPREQLGRYALEVLRYRRDGSEDPDFVLNRPAFRVAPILIAGANFGCGSSREGAVWALMAAGLRCVIAESFGDIFYNNCFQNGMLPVALPEPAITAISAQTGEGEPLTVDLVSQSIALPDGQQIGFEIDAARRKTLLEGIDEIELTPRQRDDIVAWQQYDRAARGWVWVLSGA